MSVILKKKGWFKVAGSGKKENDPLCVSSVGEMKLQRSFYEKSEQQYDLV